MPGTLALVGAGEFLETMKDVDAKLLARCGGKQVVVLPIASAPDGPGVPERWGRMGVDHFTQLGAQVKAVMALDRNGCHDSVNVENVRAANLVYFSGGKPDYLHNTLVDTPLWQAVKDVLDHGGVVAGCSAGAMIMGSYLPAFSSMAGIPLVSKWQAGFALVPNAIIAPHYNEFPEAMLGLFMGGRPANTFLLGIDADTAMVGMGHDWTVMGARRVTVKRDKETERFVNGQSISI